MDNRSAIDEILPICLRENSCDCFNIIFRTPSFYDSKDVLQYTTYNQTELKKYIDEIKKHQEKDRLLSQSKFNDVSAREVKRANDHFLESVKKFQLYINQNQEKGECVLEYFGQDIELLQLINFYEQIGLTSERSIVLFNQPGTQVQAKFLSETLELHLICLYIFYQYYNLCVYDSSKMFEPTPTLLLSYKILSKTFTVSDLENYNQYITNLANTTFFTLQSDRELISTYSVYLLLVHHLIDQIEHFKKSLDSLATLTFDNPLKEIAPRYDLNLCGCIRCKFPYLCNEPLTTTFYYMLAYLNTCQEKTRFFILAVFEKIFEIQGIHTSTLKVLYPRMSLDDINRYVTIKE